MKAKKIMTVQKKSSLQLRRESENPFNWYGITETSKAILGDLLAYTAREEIKKSMKETPDQNI